MLKLCCLFQVKQHDAHFSSWKSAILYSAGTVKAGGYVRTGRIQYGSRGLCEFYVFQRQNQSRNRNLAFRLWKNRHQIQNSSTPQNYGISISIIKQSLKNTFMTILWPSSDVSNWLLYQFDVLWCLSLVLYVQITKQKCFVILRLAFAIIVNASYFHSLVLVVWAISQHATI